MRNPITDTSGDTRPTSGRNQRKAGVGSPASAGVAGEMDSRPPARERGPKHHIKVPKTPPRGKMKSVY